MNNAGAHEDALLGTMPVASWDRVLAINLDGVFHGCQAVLPTMISQRHGRIVNIASLSALLVPPGQANYAAANLVLESLAARGEAARWVAGSGWDGDRLRRTNIPKKRQISC